MGIATLNKTKIPIKTVSIHMSYIIANAIITAVKIMVVMRVLISAPLASILSKYCLLLCEYSPLNIITSLSPPICAIVNTILLLLNTQYCNSMLQQIIATSIRCNVYQHSFTISTSSYRGEYKMTTSLSAYFVNVPRYPLCPPNTFAVLTLESALSSNLNVTLILTALGCMPAIIWSTFLQCACNCIASSNHIVTVFFIFVSFTFTYTKTQKKLTKIMLPVISAYNSWLSLIICGKKKSAIVIVGNNKLTAIPKYSVTKCFLCNSCPKLKDTSMLFTFIVSVPPLSTTLIGMSLRCVVRNVSVAHLAFANSLLFVALLYVSIILNEVCSCQCTYVALQQV